MKTIYIFTLLAILMASNANATAGDSKAGSVEGKSAQKQIVKDDERTTSITVVNNLLEPPSTLIMTDFSIDGGFGDLGVPEEIEAGSELILSTYPYDDNTDLSAEVIYKVEADGTLLTIHWTNPASGSNGYSFSSTTDKYWFKTSGRFSSRNPEVTVEIFDGPEYSAIIMADPQPWRLDNGVDPNSTKNEASWKTINKNTHNSMMKLGRTMRFGIVNGDLSEFGRPSQYQDYRDLYVKNSAIYVFEGLGNHDYENNVKDCTMPEDWNFSKDACAITAVRRQYNAILSNKNSHSTVKADNFSYDAKYANTMYQGSLAYSWDVSDIHYVQLQNFPTYKVHLSDPEGDSADITPSLDWLSKDLANAKARGKITILNFHDAMPGSSFFNTTSDSDRAKFKAMITSNDVIAVFVGHTHVQAFCRANDDRFFGNIPLYTAGALFKGDYYQIDVKEHDVNVKAINGKSGTPVLLHDYGLIGSNAVNKSSCS